MLRIDLTIPAWSGLQQRDDPALGTISFIKGGGVYGVAARGESNTYSRNAMNDLPEIAIPEVDI